MAEDKEARELIELSRRLAEKDKQDKSKSKKYQANGMSLTED
jgi:hypothetical protein